MTKLQKIALFAMVLLVALLVFVEATRPQPVNWFQSYSRVDKIPLGTYVLHDLLREKLQDRFIEKDRPPFEVLSDTTLSGTYFFVNGYVNFDETELKSLLQWTEKGNTLFVASHSFSRKMLDTLSLELSTAYLLDNTRTQPMVELVNKNLKTAQPYHIERDLLIRQFSKIDTTSNTVIGVSQAFEDTVEITDPKINFIKVPFGDGTILLHTQPEVFSNYFLLEKNNAAYIEGVLSYVKTTQNFYWDNHYKSGNPIQLSPLHILLNNKHLKWGYYFMLIGALLFVLFEGKRKQRNIPIVTPPSNKTYEYTRTIAGMYYDQKDYKAIAEKQIILFLEYIRTRLRIPTETINKRFFKQVAARSGNTLEDTQELFALIENVQHTSKPTADQIMNLTQEINTYKHYTDGKS